MATSNGEIVSSNTQLVAIVSSLLFVLYHLVYGEGRGVNPQVPLQSLLPISYTQACLIVYPFYVVAYSLVRFKPLLALIIFVFTVLGRLFLETMCPASLYIVVHPINAVIGLWVIWFTLAYPSIIIYRVGRRCFKPLIDPEFKTEDEGG